MKVDADRRQASESDGVIDAPDDRVMVVAVGAAARHLAHALACAGFVTDAYAPDSGSWADASHGYVAAVVHIERWSRDLGVVHALREQCTLQVIAAVLPGRDSTPLYAAGADSCADAARPAEVAAAVSAAVRRVPPASGMRLRAPAPALRVGVNNGVSVVLVRGLAVDLHDKPLELMAHLWLHRDEVVTDERINRALWPDRGADTRQLIANRIYVNFSRARSAIGPMDSWRLHRHRNQGIRLIIDGPRPGPSSSDL